jgi:hypothetical protein
MRKSVTVKESPSATAPAEENLRSSFSNNQARRKEGNTDSPSPNNQSRLLKIEYESPLADLDRTGRQEA